MVKEPQQILTLSGQLTICVEEMNYPSAYRIKQQEAMEATVRACLKN
jgi:hypothetical protein